MPTPETSPQGEEPVVEYLRPQNEPSVPTSAELRCYGLLDAKFRKETPALYELWKQIQAAEQEQ